MLLRWRTRSEQQTVTYLGSLSMFWDFKQIYQRKSKRSHGRFSPCIGLPAVGLKSCKWHTCSFFYCDGTRSPSVMIGCALASDSMCWNDGAAGLEPMMVIVERDFNGFFSIGGKWLNSPRIGWILWTVSLSAIAYIFKVSGFLVNILNIGECRCL